MKKNKYNILRLFLLLLTILAIFSCNEKKSSDRYLYPIRENGLYGYIDSVGNRILEPKFLWVSTFHDGLAMAVVDTVYREVPDSMAYEVGERDTVINMYRMYVKYGYIDKTGKFLIKPTFVCYISMPQNGFHVKDLQECSNALYLHVFQNNRALFSDTITWKNGYIDKNGNIVISPKYYYSDPFFNGKAIVMLPKGEQLLLNDWIITRGKLRSAYIDTTGNAITDFKYEKLTRFNGRRGIGSYKEIFSNVAGINDSFTEHNYIIDENGTEIKDLGFWNQFYGFSKDGIGLARQVMRLQVSDGMPDSYSFVDEKGHYLEPLKGLSEYQLDSIGKCEDIIQVLPEDAEISHATHFNEGFAGISPDGEHWFVIDRYLLIHGYGEESVFEKFKVFNNGLAAVKKNGKWGYINKQIREQIPCKYDSCGLAYPFLEEIFEYDIQGNIKKVAYINRNDSLVWESIIPKPVEIKNKYSNKEKVNYGQWTYKYNSFLDHIPLGASGVLGALLFVVIIVCALITRSSQQKEIKPEATSSSEILTEIVETNSTIYVDNEAVVEPHLFPSVGQYTETIKLAAKSPEDYFDKLSNLRPVLDDTGEPVMSSGNFAVVFKMVDEKGKYHAVRCFHREQEGRGRNYKLICEELNKVSSPYLSPIKYFEKELYIDSVEYPVLLMDWVDGVPLDKYLREIINDNTKLRSIAEQFRQLAIWLLDQPFAHGDLKPDNILVKEDDSLVLVDYDGMFVPAMQGQKARELGSPDFRDPSRTEMDFDKNIDNFPIVSILLSLELLGDNMEYLTEYGEDDRLLFSEEDYRNIDNCKIFKIAYSSHCEDVTELADQLRKQINGTDKEVEICSLLRAKGKRIEAVEGNSRRLKIAHKILVIYNVLVPLSAFVYSKIIPSKNWNILGLSAVFLCTAIAIYITIGIIDLTRPYKRHHLYIDDDYSSIGCVLSLFCLHIPLVGLLSSNYKGEWYITLLVLIIWFVYYLIMGSALTGSRELHSYIFKSDEEIKIEEEEKKREVVRSELLKEIEKEQKKKKEIEGKKRPQ